MDLKPGTKVRTDKFGVVVVDDLPHYSGPCDHAGVAQAQTTSKRGFVTEAGWRVYFNDANVIEVL